MSDVQRSSFVKRVTAVFAPLAAIATFDPHFENVEFITYGLYAFLLELTLVAAIGLGILAVRAGAVALVARHWKLFGTVTAIIAFVTIDLADSMARTSQNARRQDLKVYAGGLRAPIFSWVKTRREAYSSRQVELFGTDMTIRAVDAFARHDLAGSAAYLRAADRVNREGMGTIAASGAADYLVSRNRYIANHRDRVAALSMTSPMAPVRLYMMRAVERLESGTHGANAELVATESRLRTAVRGAQAAIDQCLVERRVPVADGDARAVTILVFETMGGLPAFGAKTDPRRWCSALSANPDVKARGAAAFGQRFADLARNMWGEALNDPADRDRVVPSDGSTPASIASIEERTEN